MRSAESGLRSPAPSLLSGFRTPNSALRIDGTPHRWTMAKIRVTCPACQDTLEVDEGLVGKEVECGSCLQPFTVEDPKKPKKYRMRRSESDDDEEDRKKPPSFRGRPRRPRDEDDEDDRDEGRHDEGPPPRPVGSTIASVTIGTAAL